MTKAIKNFSRKVEKIGINGEPYTVHVDLVVMDWGESCPVAYTFNCYEREFQDAFAEALEEFGKLRYVTGVTGDTFNDIMQANVIKAMTDKYGDKVKISSGLGKHYTSTFELVR